jgi:hypothetical protein
MISFWIRNGHGWEISVKSLHLQFNKAKRSILLRTMTFTGSPIWLSVMKPPIIMLKSHRLTLK